MRNNANVIENQSAPAAAMDTDFAKETANLTRTQILQQAGTAMLAQANALPQNVLSLLGLIGEERDSRVPEDRAPTDRQVMAEPARV